MPADVLTRRVIYHGRVQGIGFRATARHVAQGFRVEGFVRNLPDGTVELMTSGEAAEVTRFLDAVAYRFAANLDDVEETPITQEHIGQGFTIR